MKLTKLVYRLYDTIKHQTDLELFVTVKDNSDKKIQNGVDKKSCKDVQIKPAEVPHGCVFRHCSRERCKHLITV